MLDGDAGEVPAAARHGFRPLRRSRAQYMSITARDSRHAIPSPHWPTIVARAEGESLRMIARDYGVSPNAIRTVLVSAGHANLLIDQERRQRLATSGPLPPPAPRKVAQDRYAEVVELCQHHTQAEVAEMFGVSQTTVWRIVQQAKKRMRSGHNGPVPV